MRISVAEQSAAAAGSALVPYSPPFAFTRLAVGVDNIRYDVFLSPRWREQASQFLFQQILFQAQPHLRSLYSSDARRRTASTSEFKRRLGRVLQEAVNRAKELDNIEVDLLARLAIYQWLLMEMQHQFSELAIACRAQVEKMSSLSFQGGTTAFVLRSKIADFQSNRRPILRAVGETLFQIFDELEANTLQRSRVALFGTEFRDFYQVVRNRLVFLENPYDAVVHLEHYVMLGHFGSDVDHEERVGDLLGQFIREQGLAHAAEKELARLEEQRRKCGDELQEVNRRLREAQQGKFAPSASSGRLRFRWLWGRAGRRPAEVERTSREQALNALEAQRQQRSREVEELEQKVAFLRQTHQTGIGELLSNPANAERLFGALAASGVPAPRTRSQKALLRQLYTHLERAGMLNYILASYHLKPLYKSFCPPLNPQQLKYAVVDRKGWGELEKLLDQFSTHNFPVEKLEEVARRLRRLRPRDAETILARFARDLMRLRRDFLHLQRLHSMMEKIHLVGDEKTRSLSRLNGSLYEFLLPEEQEAGEERILTHVVVKADVRDSTRITEELLRRGLNPATHFSFNFFEPVHKLTTRYSASKIFIEGDALILAIYETETNRAFQRPVAKACLLAKEIIHLCRAYNERARAHDLPVLELGLGIAFQDSPPHYWTDSGSRIMISAALNRSDQLSSCARIARKLVGQNHTLFHVFDFQSYPALGEEEQEDFLLRYNVMGVGLNEPGFEKLQQEISLTRTEMAVDLWARREKVTLHCGTVPLGNSFEKLIIREGRVARIRFPGGQIEQWTPRAYYEVCVHPKLYEQFPRPAMERRGAVQS